jgi:hypothetical protein
MAQDHTSPTGDPHIEAAERKKAENGVDADRAADLFDIRRIIGGLLGIYGVILLVAGITASDADIDKAAGLNVNLWTGVALLAVAAIFVAWALLRPLSREREQAGA